jgi:transposase
VALAPIAPKGFAWRRPRHPLKGRQDAAAVAASRQHLADLKTQAAAGAIDLVFLDESEALTHPYLARCWARRGTELRIQAPGQAKKRAMLGAFDPLPHGSSPWAEGPWRLLVHTSATKRSTDFIDLLDQIAAAYGTAERSRPLVAVLDNGPIHTSKLTTKALAARTWLTLEWLPKYAPELNDPGSRPGQAIERCWRDLKQHQLANRTFADADALARAIPDAVARLNHERQPHSSPIRRRPA